MNPTCIYCENEISTPLDKVHILPESAGNLTHILGHPVVCRKCNNYFGTKVEKPFLESQFVTINRSQMRIPSKSSGLVPSATGLLFAHGVHLEVQLDMNEEFPRIAPLHEKDLVKFISVLRPGSEGTMRFPAGVPPPKGLVTSRFVAKIAVEALLLRLEELGHQFITEARKSLRPLARHARYGEHKNWEILVRQAYPADTAFSDGSSVYDLPHEFAFDGAEDMIFFFLRMFGVEFALDMGCDEVKRVMHHVAALEMESPMKVDTIFQMGSAPAVVPSEWTKWT